VQRLRHDVRQPLSAVLVLAAAAGADPTLSAQARDRLRLIQDEAERISEILASTEDDTPYPQVVDLASAVESTVAAVAAASACRVALVQDDRAEVLVDPVGLRRSVRNILENAVRAVGTHGSVEVRVRRNGGEAVLEVADSGPGFGKLAPQQGLGLLTVRRFVEQSSGRFAVSTSPLGGALVSLRLPAVQRPALCVAHGDPA
jgi:signal transduction histidine kinase